MNKDQLASLIDFVLMVSGELENRMGWVDSDYFCQAGWEGWGYNYAYAYIDSLI